ncbi:MAG: RES domain-containing protein [Chloroflexota bacterium]|nr:RES domain-containing protein [Chloroflexota bacterium]
MSGWERFVEHVKHQSRYYFLTEPAGGREDDGRSPDELKVSEIPTHLGEAVGELELIREVGVGEPLYRARLGCSGETFQGAQQLGTAPASRARSANRMSPAGIAMFYGASDEQTAIAEV